MFLQFPLEPALGGAEELTVSLAVGLADNGYEIQLLSSNKLLVERFSQNRLATKYLWAGWEPTTIKSLFLFPLTAALAAGIFFYFLARYSPKIVFCLTLTDKLVASVVARALGITPVFIELTRLGRWFFKNPLLPFYRLCARSCKIVAPSFFLRNQLLSAGAPVDQITIIYPGVSLATVARDVKNQGPGEKTVGFLGRLASEKGIDLLLTALAMLPPSYKLLIAGDGPARGALRELTATLNLEKRVNFLGWVSDKRSFFSKISVLVVPSTQAESFGLVVTEAMAWGVPVIASRLGAIPEVIEHNKTGFLIKPKAAEIIKYIRSTAENEKTTGLITRRARRAVELRFDRKRMLDDYLRLIRLLTT